MQNKLTNSRERLSRRRVGNVIDARDLGAEGCEHTHAHTDDANATSELVDEQVGWGSFSLPIGKDERTCVTFSEWRTTDDKSPCDSAAPERSVNLFC